MYDELKRLRVLTDALISAEERLEASTRRWEYALNAIPNLVFITDINMTIKFVNQAMCHAFDKEIPFFIDKKCFEIISNCSNKGMCYCNEYESEEVVDLEDIYVLGTNRWYNHTKSPIYEEGILIGYICVLTDITERKTYEEALARREAMLRAIYRSTPAGIGVMNTSRIVLWVNDKIPEMSGYKKEEIEGKDIKILYPDVITYKEAGKLKRKQILKSGYGTIETKWKKKNDEIMDVLMSSTIMDGDERIAFVVQDITDFKRTERELIKDENRLEALLKLSQLQNVSEIDLINNALEACVELTDSEIGYFHFYDPEEISLGLFTWSKNTLKECKASTKAHYPLEKAGIWADCIRLKRPVIHNNDLSIKEFNLPDGHVEIKRHLSIPVFDNNKNVVAVVGVGNKEEQYSDADIRQLQLFMESLWKTISANRAAEELERLIKTLRENC